MSRISIPTLDDAPAASRPILEAVNGQLGLVPNLFRLVALSPAALAGMTGLSGALSKALDVKTRERLAIATAQVNGCDYCLSAHTYLGLNLARLSPEEIALNRNGASSDAKADAAVRFGATDLGHRPRRRPPGRLHRRPGHRDRGRRRRELPDQPDQQRGRHRHRFPGQPHGPGGLNQPCAAGGASAVGRGSVRRTNAP